MPHEVNRDRLRENVRFAGEAVVERLGAGLAALERRDEELAWEVVEGGHEVAEMSLDIESECTELAFQQSTAGDRRFVAASFGVVTALERIGALATTLGNHSLDARREVVPEVDLQEIGDAAVEMTRTAVDAYTVGESRACFDVADRDETVDDLCESPSETVARRLLDLAPEAAEEAEVRQLLREVRRLQTTVRTLERAGDRAVDVAAHALYAVEGDDDLLY